jgi:hypothetical protein
MREKVLRTSAVEIGKLVFAWGDLHTALSHIFSFVLDQSMMGVAHAVWHSTPSDRTQRGMLNAAVNRCLLPDARKKRPHVTDRLIESVQWLLKEADVLANQRNTIVHSGYWVERKPDQTLIPAFNPLSGRKALASYGKVVLPDDIQNLRRKTEVLADYANAIVWALFRPDGVPWPKKPSLPTRGKRTRGRSHRRSKPRAV